MRTLSVIDYSPKGRFWLFFLVRYLVIVFLKNWIIQIWCLLKPRKRLSLFCACQNNASKSNLADLASFWRPGLKSHLKFFSCKTVKLRFTKFIVEEFLASDNKTCRYDKVLISWTDYKGPTFEGKFIYLKSYIDGHFGSRSKNYPVFSLSSKNKFCLLYSAADEFLWNTPKLHTDLSVQLKDHSFSAPKISQFKFHTKNPQFNTPLSSTRKTPQFNTAYIELFFVSFFCVEVRGFRC